MVSTNCLLADKNDSELGRVVEMSRNIKELWSGSQKKCPTPKKYKFYLKWLYLMQLTIKLYLASFITFL